MNEDKLECNINIELLEQFNLALTLNKENIEDVVTRLVSNYVSDSFIRAAKNITTITSAPKFKSHVLNNDINYGKANRKIPVWATRSNQNNHKIIKAYLQIEEEQGQVKYEELAERCSNPTLYPDTFVSDFRGNFAQMKTDASNSHGKVFILEGDIVEIWDEVVDTMQSYREYFLNSQSGGVTMKITNDMTEKAYEIAKKVYNEQIGRNEAKYEIAKTTGMNVGSAGDYISNLLAMLEGKRYTRTLNTYATKYFLLNIKSDFGIDAFKKALNATSEHIKYYNSLGHGNLNSIQEVVDELK